MSVYNRIDSVRKGITWKYINDHVDGAYHGRMTDLKNNKTTLSGSQLRSVAEILGTTVDYLLEKTDDPSPAGQKESSPKIGELTEDELRLLMAYRAASEKKRASLLGLLED